MLACRFHVALVVGVALVSQGCNCCSRKGFVLRGDWSLELNRVPHLKSNGPTYPAECDDGCCEPVGCADGCLSGGPNGCILCEQQGAGLAGTCRHGRRLGVGRHGAFGAPDDGTGQALLGGRFGPGGHFGAGGGLFSDAAPPPPEPTPAAPTRFHPVPTRPAFEPYAALEPAAPAASEYSPPAPAVPKLSNSSNRNAVAWRNPSSRG